MLVWGELSLLRVMFYADDIHFEIQVPPLPPGTPTERQ